jgi:hypothetical protein
LSCFIVQPDDAEEQKRKEIAPAPRAFEGADIDDAEHGRQDQRVAQRRELGELPREGVAEAGAEDIRDGDRPDQRIGHVEVARQHFGSRHEAVDQESAEQERH